MPAGWFNKLPTSVFKDLVEKVMILRKALQLKTGNGTEVTSPILAEKLTSYAELLAAQGNMSSATGYLGDSNQPKIQELRERLYRAQGMASGVVVQKSTLGVAPTRQSTAEQPQRSPFSRVSNSTSEVLSNVRVLRFMFLTVVYSRAVVHFEQCPVLKSLRAAFLLDRVICTKITGQA